MNYVKRAFEVTATLLDLRVFLRENIRKGAICPACEQVVHMNPTSYDASMAAILVEVYRIAETQPIHVSDLIRRSRHPHLFNGGKLAKNARWGLVEEVEYKEKRGGRKNGWWKVTEKGISFATRQMRIPSMVLLYNQKAYGFGEETFTIVDALRNKFDYDTLIRPTTESELVAAGLTPEIMPPGGSHV